VSRAERRRSEARQRQRVRVQKAYEHAVLLKQYHHWLWHSWFGDRIHSPPSFEDWRHMTVVQEIMES
jgi:hypothetical protein